MSKPANQSNNWNFTVTQRQLPSPIAGRGPLPFYGNFRDDTGECLGVTSEQYGLIQNVALLDAAHAALESRGLSGYTEKHIVTAGGAKFFTEFTFANKQLATAVGDVFGYKLTLKNSFDRTIRAAFQLGFLRLACTNGMATLEKEFSVTRKHSLKVSVDFLGEAIDQALDNGQNALKVYDQMAQIALTDDQGVNVLNQLVEIDALSGTLRESIKTLWLAPRRAEDKARNLYNLYNAVTEHLTHQVSRERYEYADKVSNGILFRFVNAARKPDHLAKLILPVPAKNSSVTVNTENVIDVETVVSAA